LAWFEEIYPNKGGLYGAKTGKKYDKSDTEDIGGVVYSKPCHYLPGDIVLEVEPDDPIVEPHEYMEKE
jgi:hypothetical protein